MQCLQRYVAPHLHFPCKSVFRSRQLVDVSNEPLLSSGMQKRSAYACRDLVGPSLHFVDLFYCG